MKQTRTLLFLLSFLLNYSPIHAQSILQTHTFYSNALETQKSYRVYLPDGYEEDTLRHYPVVYFLRLHETEWFSPLWRTNGMTLKHVADELISTGKIGKIIIVTPSTGGNNPDPNFTAGGIVNMLRPDLANNEGIGTGKFEDYFFKDLIPLVDSTFRTIPARCGRGIDGFSLGGYASTLYAVKHPGYFSSVGSYDGTIMWYDLDYPAQPGAFDDDNWFNPGFSYLTNPMFDLPLNTDYMKLNSAINLIAEADENKLDSIREMSFHIRSASSAILSNYPVNVQFMDTLNANGIFNTFSNLELSSGAYHNYTWADVYAKESLVKHWETFTAWSCSDSFISNYESKEKLTILPKISPNPASDFITISCSDIPTSKAGILLRIFNHFGNELKRMELLPGDLNQPFRLDLSSFSNGAYWLKLEVDGQSFKAQQFSILGK